MVDSNPTKLVIGRDAVATTTIKGDESRARILDAALIEFGKAGFKATTTRRIVERAQTTLPPLNYYFGSKEGLYRACVEETIRRFRSTTGQAIVDAQRAIDDMADAATARATLKQLLAAAVELMLGTQAFSEGSGIIARELAEPGPGFDIFYETLWLPGIERQARLIARIKSESAPSTESRTQAVLFISSIASFHTRRFVAQKAIGWQTIGPEERAVLVSILHHQVDSI